MPTVHNGIGTWYYGKRKIHRFKGICGFCNRVGELQSYDTTLYFVLFFVPIIPLSRKRVLETCPHRGKHRVLPLKKWEELKNTDVEKLLVKLDQNSDDSATILEALGLAVAYQDQDLFEKLSSGLAKHRTEDARIQFQLGLGYSYFARRAEAETAFRASLALEDTPEIRERLAINLLKQGRPEEALPFLHHVLDQKQKNGIGIIQLLIEGYQAEGMHAEALDIMTQRDTAFPDQANSKESKGLRKISERHLQTGKKIRSPNLTESNQVGYQEGAWTARIPRIIGPAIGVGLLFWYLGAALYYGQFRKVYLVNGWEKPYAVEVNGRNHNLEPGTATPIIISEGEVTVEPADPKVPMEPVHCRVETGFWGRPFGRKTFIINPDQLAVVVQEKVEFAENPRPPARGPEIYVGQPFQTFDAVDFEFIPLPATVPVNRGQSVWKTGISMAKSLTLQARLGLAETILDKDQQIAFGKRILIMNPSATLALDWLVGLLPPSDLLELLKTGLGVQPLRVEWHRVYQSTLEKVHPQQDLIPQYRKLVVDTQNNPDAIYLLGRAMSRQPEEAAKIFHQAAEANPPSFFAMNALAFDAMAEADYETALPWAEKAFQKDPQNPTFQSRYLKALFAARKWDRLQAQLQKQSQLPGENISSLVYQIRMFAVRQDKANARESIAMAMRLFPAAGSNDAKKMFQDEMEMVLCAGLNDQEGFLRIASRNPSIAQFSSAFLKGDLSAAARASDKAPDQILCEHALLYLAATKANQKNLAEEQWKLLLAAMAKDHMSVQILGQILSGKEPVHVDRVRRLPIDPQVKRALVAVVAKKFPQTEKELLPLARKLDYSPDSISLCLRKVWE